MSDEIIAGTAKRTDAESRLLADGIAAVELGFVRHGRTEHVALLVSDDDLQTARMAMKNASHANLHFFSPSGAEGAAFRLDHPDYRKLTLAVFPYQRARQLLENATHAEGLRDADRFRIAAYVRAYFGSAGRLMGLPTGATDMHDLSGLTHDAQHAPKDLPDRPALDQALSEWQWRPSEDMLERLSLADPWIRETLLPQASETGPVPPGLTLFFCRARAVEQGFLEPIAHAIETTGFEILRSLPLEGELAKRVEETTRGGNWGAGPFPVSGGAPVSLFVAVDVFPCVPSPAILKKHPFLDNQRTLKAKLAARDMIFAQIPASAHFNPLHSTDTSREAMRVLQDILPDQEFDKLRRMVQTLRQEVEALTGSASYLPGDHSISALLRTETDLGPCLRKVFRRQYSKHLPTIQAAHEKLARTIPEYPPIIAGGPTFLDCPDPGSTFRPLGVNTRPLPAKTLQRLRMVLAQAAEQGALPTAFDPRSDILISQDGQRLCLPPFDTSCAQASAQTLSEFVPPAQPLHSGKSGYADIWYPALRVPRQVFLHGHALPLLIFSRLIYPCHDVLRRSRKFARRIIAAVWRRAKRLGSNLSGR